MIIRDVKPARLNDDAKKHSQSIMKNLNYASYTELVRMVNHPEALA